jgi:hypothetical protein
MMGKPNQNNSLQKAQKLQKTCQKTIPLNILIIF